MKKLKTIPKIIKFFPMMTNSNLLNKILEKEVMHLIKLNTE